MLAHPCRAGDVATPIRYPVGRRLVVGTLQVGDEGLGGLRGHHGSQVRQHLSGQSASSIRVTSCLDRW